jgi:pimeloyl-ACP methyl ester carboxylesterase
MTGKGMRIPEIVYAVLVALVVLMLLSGCGERQVLMCRQGLDEGLIIVLPGIDGRAPHNEAACRTLGVESTGMAVELYDWTAPLGPLFNQRAIGRNRQMARRLARRIAAYHESHPGRCVCLVGHSGGTAIAVWAAEALPHGEQVEAIVLLASSLSPGYDLRKATARARKGVASFHSRRDSALLGAATTLFGTMDGEHTEAAGKVGFRAAGGRGRGAEGKLVQIAWAPRMADCGNDGGHFSCLAGGFLSAYVSPLLGAREWDERLLAAVRAGRAAAPGPALAALVAE